MNLLPTFGFKGSILPIIDKNDRIYVFIKNETDSRVLLNIITQQTNTFVNIGPKLTKLVNLGFFTNDAEIKVFYMGHELFNFSGKDIDYNSLLLYSNFIIKNIMDIDKMTFFVSFCNGCKVDVNSNKSSQLYVKLVDKTTNEIINEDTFFSGTPYIFNRKYFINYDVFIYNLNGQLIYRHEFDLTNKKVCIKLESKSLGDTLAWIPYVEEFRKKHNCEVVCVTNWNDIFKKVYPDIEFISPNIIINNEEFYSMYEIKCNIPPELNEYPIDYRDVSLQQIASKSLGLNHKEIKPLVFSDNNPKIIDDNYAVISTMSTCKAKLWNCEDGWQDIIDYLNSKGLKVVILQKEKENRYKNVINMSGSDDIFKSINIIKYSKFLIGLSSGLSWLAWGLNKKVVMISGFTNPNNEFKENNYRVINKSVCNSCWNDKKYTFDRSDWFWCPRKKNFECTKSIDSQMVINKIDEILNIESK